MEHGVLCVMMDGPQLMLKLSVDNWDGMVLSQHIEVLILDEDMDQSGWIMYDAGETRVDLINVLTDELVITTVGIMKMLVWLVCRVSTCESFTVKYLCCCLNVLSVLL